MARFWLGPPQWNDQWSPPAGVVGWLDMRSLPQCAQRITPSGFGLFVTANATALGSEYTNLGTDPERTLTETQKRRWESALLLPRRLVTNRLMGIVYETITLQADPIGDDRCLPLMPNMRRRFEVWLAGSKVSDREWSFTAPEFTVCCDTLKRIYRQLRADSLEGKLPPELYRKWLGFQVRKYRLRDNQYRALQPADLPDESPLEPTTTITDNFDRANAATLGANWTTLAGTHEIVTNRAKSTASDAWSYHNTALSSDDHYSQQAAEVFGSSGGQCRASGRADLSALTGYAFILTNSTSLTWRLFKRVAGTFTQIGTTVAETVPTLPVTVKLQVDGSSLSGYEGVNLKVGPNTDTAITGNVNCGISNNAALAETDNFEAADLAAAASAGLLLMEGLFVGSGSGGLA